MPGAPAGCGSSARVWAVSPLLAEQFPAIQDPPVLSPGRLLRSRPPGRDNKRHAEHPCVPCVLPDLVIGTRDLPTARRRHAAHLFPCTERTPGLKAHPCAGQCRCCRFWCSEAVLRCTAGFAGDDQVCTETSTETPQDCVAVGHLHTAD